MGFGVGLKVSLGAIGLSGWGWGPCNQKFNCFILDSQNSSLLRSRILDGGFRRMISPAPSALTCPSLKAFPDVERRFFSRRSLHGLLGQFGARGCGLCWPNGLMVKVLRCGCSAEAVAVELRASAVLMSMILLVLIPRLIAITITISITVIAAITTTAIVTTSMSITTHDHAVSVTATATPPSPSPSRVPSISTSTLRPSSSSFSRSLTFFAQEQPLPHQCHHGFDTCMPCFWTAQASN